MVHFNNNLKSSRIPPLILVLLLYGLQPAWSQKWALHLRHDSIQCLSFRVDKKQNIYVVSAKNFVHQFNVDGELRHSFSGLPYGKIGTLDVTNAERPMVYFPDKKTAVILNEHLEVIDTLALKETGAIYADIAAMGDDGFLYIYEGYKQRIVKFQLTEGGLKQAGSLENIDFRGFPIQRFQVKDGVMYFNIPTMGFRTFDTKGKPLNTYDLINVSDFEVHGDCMVFSHNKILYQFDFKTAMKTRVETSKFIEGRNNATLAQGRLVVQRGWSVDVYQSGGN
jgi:hypothetical protein